MLLSHLTTAKHKKLALLIGQRLRQSQFARLRAQQNLDGSPFTSRKKGFIALRQEMKLLIDGERVHSMDVQQRGKQITGIDAKRRQKRSVCNCLTFKALLKAKKHELPPDD